MDIRTLIAADLPAATLLLEQLGLQLPTDTRLGIGAFEDKRLLGCCFLKDDMLQGLAVDPSRQGEGLSGRLAGEMVKRAFSMGISHLTVITKPQMTAQIREIGFRLVASAPPYAALLEMGQNGIDPFLRSLEQLADGKPMPRAAVVLNANPFTNGHLHLLKRACAENAWVVALVLQEDASEFPFADRLRLVREGTKDLPNLSVLPGGRYVVSKLTFPSYFTQQQDLASAQGALDAAIFAERIAPALQLTRRYVGTEPISAVTEQYNRALIQRLPRDGIEVIEVPRLEMQGQPVSASRVRAAFHAGELDSVRALVPNSTYQYLKGIDHGDG